MSDRVMLVAPRLLDRPGVGGMVLRKYLALPGAPELGVAELIVSRDRRRAPMAALDRLLVGLALRVGRYQAWRVAVYRRHGVARDLAALAEQAARVGTQRYWLIAEPRTIALGRRLAERHDVRVLVWDDPDYIVANLRLPATAARKVRDDFAALLASAREGMAERYSALREAPCVILRNPVDPERIAAPRDRAPGAPLRIAFAGSLYSKREWNALVAALEARRWVLCGRAAELHYIGQFPLTGATKPRALVEHGVLAADAARDRLCGMDIGYLPYWFDPAWIVVSTTSFPGKFTTYLESGLAIFNHSRADSSISRFMARHDCGEACDSLDPEVVGARLEALAARMGTPALEAGRREAIGAFLPDAVDQALVRFLGDRRELPR